MAADQQTKQQAAAEALRGLLRGGGAAVRAAFAHPDPDVRKAAAKRLLTGTPLGDPEAAALRKDAAPTQKYIEVTTDAKKDGQKRFHVTGIEPGSQI